MPANRPRALGAKGEKRALVGNLTMPSALLLRKLLGPIRMEPVMPDIGRPYYRALSNLDALAIVEIDPDSPDSEPGSTALRWWRRRQSR